ncbi:20314_t:CDS:2, partial [Racocetra persica]
MIQLKTILNVIDNSGAILAECIRVAHGGRYGRIGDAITVVIKKAHPISQVAEKTSGGSAANLSTKLSIRKGEVKKALIVRTRKETRRPDGRYIRFDDNACILLNNRQEPLATRVLGVVGNELRDSIIDMRVHDGTEYVMVSYQDATKLPDWHPISRLRNAEGLIKEYKIKASQAEQRQVKRKAREGKLQKISGQIKSQQDCVKEAKDINVICKNKKHDNSQRSTESVKNQKTANFHPALGRNYKSDGEMTDVECVFEQSDKLLIGIGECLSGKPVSNVKIKCALKNECVSKDGLGNTVFVKRAGKRKTKTCKKTLRPIVVLNDGMESSISEMSSDEDSTIDFSHSNTPLIHRKYREGSKRLKSMEHSEKIS